MNTRLFQDRKDEFTPPSTQRNLMKKEIIAILTDIRPEYDFLENIDFIESGMLDSFDILALVTELEEKFQIKIYGSDILARNFRSVENIEALVIKSKNNGK